jgi:dephospho-CoA kinase
MSKPSSVVGITGGISTGKSTFARRLHELTGGKLFDADRAARVLTDEDEQVRAAVREEFGAEIFSEAGDLNRVALRAIVFANQGKKRALEQILHPRIRRQWATEAEKSRRSGEIFLADIPLLYETEGQKLCDRVVVVACAPQIQLQRLTRRTRLTHLDALRMIDSQMPLSEKISLADHVIWNNGPLALLEAETELMARYLMAK